MKKQSRIVLFFLILAVNITGILLANRLLDYISKPLIVLLLMEYLFSQTRHITDRLSKWVFAALFFSWVGDILLLFQASDKLFFLLGLSVFLIAHIFYIIFFHLVRVNEKIKSRPWLLIIIVIYYAGLVSFLSPYLGEMKLPVRIYGIVISFMLLLALHLSFIPNRLAAKLIMAGALLFVVSDSILAINKFYQSFEAAGAIIIFTYGCAQLFLTEGAIQYIRKKDREMNKK